MGGLAFSEWRVIFAQSGILTEKTKMDRSGPMRLRFVACLQGDPFLTPESVQRLVPPTALPRASSSRLYSI